MRNLKIDPDGTGVLERLLRQKEELEKTANRRASIVRRQATEIAALKRALADLREASTDAYKAGRIPAEPFVRAGNVLRVD